MRNTLSSVSLLLLFVAVSLTGCKSDKTNTPTDPNAPTGYELAMTSQDTVNVIHLVDAFFNLVEQGNTTEALAMLYDDNSHDHFDEPLPLDNEHLNQMRKLLTALPIQGHRIEYIKFHETYENEVKVSAIIEPAEGDMPEVATVFYFRPFDYLGDWRLCLMDSGHGNQRIVSNDDADSLQQKFRDDFEQKDIQ